MPHEDIARNPQGAGKCIPDAIVQNGEQELLATDPIASQADGMSVCPCQQAHAVRSAESPIRGKGAVEKMISTATSKNSAIRSAR